LDQVSPESFVTQVPGLETPLEIMAETASSLIKTPLEVAKGPEVKGVIVEVLTQFVPRFVVRQTLPSSWTFRSELPAR